MNIACFNIKLLLLGWVMAMSMGVTGTANCAPLPMQEFDKVFSEFDAGDKPALAVVLLKNDKVLYQKAFGNANLEYKIPATLDTLFQVDSLAWEFIAYATLLLESQGKIKLDDDIRTYLPELPDYGDKVTVNHLLSSTDGLAGYRVLQSLAGWNATGPALLDLIKTQKTLNFKPGSAFSPGGDTRFILLSRIVEVASGLSFDTYAKTHLFAPLGMNNTVFVVDDGQLLPNKAVPYASAGEEKYKIDPGARAAPGPVNLYSSIRDLSLWRAKLVSAPPGGRALADKLNRPITLDRGTVIRDISSISTYGQQHAGQERGIAKTYQLGSFGGYRSSMFHFPGQDLTVVVLSAGLDYNGSYGMRLAGVLLKDDFLEPATIDYARIEGVALPLDQLRRYEGDYWNAQRALAAGVKLDNGVLYYGRTGGAQRRELIPLGGAVFRMKIEGDDHYFVKFVETAKGMSMHFIMGESDPIVFESYRAASYTDSELAQFTGTFHRQQIDSSFVFTVREGVLTARSLRAGEVAFRPVDADRFAGNQSFMGGIIFQRGRGNQITGFKVVVDEVRNLEFRKTLPR